MKLEDLIVFQMERDRCPISTAWGKSAGPGSSTQIQDIETIFNEDSLYGPVTIGKEDWGEYTSCKMWIDPAGRGRDQAGFAIVAQGFAKLWCKAAGGLDGGFSEHVLEQLCLLARQHGVMEILVESNFGLEMFGKLLEPILVRYFVEAGHDAIYPQGWKCSITSDRSTRLFGQKESRIITALEPVVNAHRLVVAPSVVADQDFQLQFCRIREERDCLDADDIVESLAEAVRSFSDSMRLDPEKAAERERDRRIGEYLQEIRRNAGLPYRKEGVAQLFTHD